MSELDTANERPPRSVMFAGTCVSCASDMEAVLDLWLPERRLPETYVVACPICEGRMDLRLVKLSLDEDEK